MSLPRHAAQANGPNNRETSKGQSVVVRAIFSIVAAVGLLILLAAATSTASLQRKARATHYGQMVLPDCHTASWREAFSLDSAKAGYIDQRMVQQIQFANKVCKSQ